MTCEEYWELMNNPDDSVYCEHEAEMSEHLGQCQSCRIRVGREEIDFNNWLGEECPGLAETTRKLNLQLDIEIRRN